MFTVKFITGQLIARFRSMEQIHAWSKRVGIEPVALCIDHDHCYRGNEWVHPDYR